MSDQWSDDQAMEALQAGVEADQVSEQPEQAPVATPAGENQQTQQAVQPETPAAPVTQNTDLFEGTPINPDELPAELQGLAKQLQAAFTQKTQSLAEERRQFEALGDIESLQQAMDFYGRVSDPANWQQLHSELSQAMQQYGMTPAEAQAAATEALQSPTESPAVPDLDSIDDPELAPLAQMLKAQQAELDAIKNEREQEQLNAQAEYQRQAFLGELQRQENAIRASHPDWDEDKVLAVYEMSSYFQGNLNQAAERLDALLNAERELYLTQKATAASETGTRVPPRGAGTQSDNSESPQTLREAEAEALEFFKARVDHYDGV